MTAFAHTKRYRTAKFKQAALLANLESNSRMGFTALSGGIDDRTRHGVCLALCIQWIENKFERQAMKAQTGRTDSDTDMADSNAVARMGTATRDFTLAMDLQRDVAKAWERHGAKMSDKFLKSVSARVVREAITVVTGDGTPLNPDTVIVQTLPNRMPFILSYRWDAAKAHAIVCYRTKSRTIIFDPNCGEMACPHSEIQTMWKAYWNDVKTVLGQPATYSLMAYGDYVSPQVDAQAEDLTDDIFGD
jgi:hypothetical protein